MKFTRVYITGSVYNLFFNLLITPEEELNTSYFITCDTIPETIRKNLVNGVFIPDMFNIKIFRTIAYIVKFRILSRLFFPFLTGAKWYGQDHLPHTPLVLGRRHYTFTEDGPTGFKSWEKQQVFVNCWAFKDSVKNKNVVKRFILLNLNPICGGIFANNDLCDELLLTSNYVPKFAQTKKITHINLKEKWDNSSEKKRNFILNVFNISAYDIKKLQSRNIIVFTQPFFEDGEVPTIEEHIEVYRKVTKNYNLKDVVFKTHPRETINYKKYFNEIEVFNKPIPFQLLSLAGVKFKEAATVCSSSVLGIPYPIKINWVGTTVHPNLFKEYGDYTPEELKGK